MSFATHLLAHTLLTVLLLLAMVTPGQTEPTSIRLCADDWPPYEYAENRKLRGVAVDMVVAVLERMEITTTEHLLVSWSRALELIRIGEIDLIVSGVKTTARMEYAHYPDEPLAQSDWVFFASKRRMKKTAYQNTDDLSGKSIGIVQGYVYQDAFLKRAKGVAKLEARTCAVENFIKLRGGRVDYVFENSRVGMHIVRKLLAQDEIEILGPPVYSEPLYALFSKATVSQEFVQRFSDELVRFKTTPEYEAILQRYRPQD